MINEIDLIASEGFITENTLKVMLLWKSFFFERKTILVFRPFGKLGLTQIVALKQYLPGRH